MGSILDMTVRAMFKDQSFTSGMKNASKKTKDLNKDLTALKKQFANVFTASAVIGFGKVALDAYDEQVKANTKLYNALHGNKQVYQELNGLAGKLQYKTLFADEVTMDAAARMAAIIGDNSDALKKLIPLAQDFATVKGMDLASAAELIGKTFASSTNALKRYGIDIEGAAGSSARLDSLVGQLTSKFQGQAEAAVVGSGALVQLKNALGEFLEIAGSNLAPGINKAASALTNVSKELNKPPKKEGWFSQFMQMAISPVFFTLFKKRAEELPKLIAKSVDIQWNSTPGAYSQAVANDLKNTPEDKTDYLAKYYDREYGRWKPSQLDEAIMGGNNGMPAVTMPYDIPKAKQEQITGQLKGMSQAWGNWVEEMQGVAEDFNEVFVDSIASGFANVIQESFSGAKTFGEALLGAVAGVLKQLGTYLIMEGVAIKAFKEALKKLDPKVAFVAGAALLAAGSALEGSIRGLGSGGGGASPVSFGQTVKVQGSVKGRDLEIINRRNN